MDIILSNEKSYRSFLSAESESSNASYFFLTIKHGQINIVKTSLEQNETIDLNQQDGKGRSPLMLAAQHGHTHIVDLLIAYGAKINLINLATYFRALDYACIQGRLQIASNLLSHDALISETTLTCAAVGNNINIFTIILTEIKKLKEASTLFLKNELYHTVLNSNNYAIVTSLMDFYINMNPTILDSRYRGTFLHELIANESILYALIFIARLSNKRSAQKILFCQDKEGKTPLLMAAKIISLSLVTAILSTPCQTENISILVNTPDKLGRTPLHYACIFGQPEMVVILLKYGANKWQKDNEDQYPSYYIDQQYDVMAKQFESIHIDGRRDVNSIINNLIIIPGYSNMLIPNRLAKKHDLITTQHDCMRGNASLLLANIANLMVLPVLSCFISAEDDSYEYLDTLSSLFAQFMIISGMTLIDRCMQQRGQTRAAMRESHYKTPFFLQRSTYLARNKDRYQTLFNITHDDECSILYKFLLHVKIRDTNDLFELNFLTGEKHKQDDIEQSMIRVFKKYGLVRMYNNLNSLQNSTSDHKRKREEVVSLASNKKQR